MFAWLWLLPAFSPYPHPRVLWSLRACACLFPVSWSLLLTYQSLVKQMNEYLNDFQAKMHYSLNFLTENTKKNEVTFLESTKVSCFVDHLFIKQTCIRYQKEWQDRLTDVDLFAIVKAHVKSGLNAMKKKVCCLLLSTHSLWTIQGGKHRVNLKRASYYNRCSCGAVWAQRGGATFGRFGRC